MRMSAALQVQGNSVMLDMGLAAAASRHEAGGRDIYVVLVIAATCHAQWLNCFEVIAAILLGVAVAEERCDSRATASGAQVGVSCTSKVISVAPWMKATVRCSLAGFAMV